MSRTAISLAWVLWAGMLCQAQTYKPLFDGKTLKGWHFQGAGSWKVLDGVIVGTHTKDGDHGHLVSDSSFTDFRLHFQWKLSSGGNSGLYFHGEKGGAGGMIGAQLEMDEAFSGGLYSTATNPWGFIYQTKAEDAGKWYRPGDWNDVVLVVDKNRVTNTQNGFITMDVTSPNLGAKGQFGFQLHATLDMTLWLRNIEWSDVPGSASMPAGGKRKRVERDLVEGEAPGRKVLKVPGGTGWIRMPEGLTRAEAYNPEGKHVWSGSSAGATLVLPAGFESGTMMVRFLP
jgi:hypothetical protein